MTLPNPLTINELVFVLLLSTPFIIWGFRHGLDAVIIAVIGVLGGMIFADTLASGVASAINTFWKIGSALVSVGFGDQFFAKIREEGGNLIQTEDHRKLLGSIIFLLITYVAFRIAFKRAGGRKNLFEGIFGALGAAITGYIIVTFLIPRHLNLPQQVEIVETQLPTINVDANVLVLIALVIVVFGVQSAKPKKK